MKKMQDKSNAEKYIPETHLSERIEKEQAAKLECLQAELEQTNLEQSTLRSELDKTQKALSKRAQKYNIQHSDDQSKIQKLLRQLRQLQYVAEEKEELKTSHAHLQQTLSEIQERAFRSMNNGGWIAPEDAKVRDYLSRLQENIKKWAKNSAFKAFGDQHSQSLSIDQKQEIMRSMSNYCFPHDWDQLVQIIPPHIEKRIPYLFTHAILSKDIFETIIGNPFFTLELQGQTDFPTTTQLLNLYQTMIKIDQTEAHIWRSQMLRLLQATDRASKSDIFFTGRLQANISQMGVERAEKFLRGPARYLLGQSSGDDKSVQKALADIYCYAGQLALSLWTQRSYLECLNRQRITHFFAGREEMSAHRFHRLDEEDTRFDRQPILVIVQPALIAFGNDNAESYDQHKVWAEAVVLVDERT
ncbi:hypothetical protein BGW36DRAFT_372417 [Talaromyces proteolyticus]|uniref:Uncharacterized protein n=1 Tax=Talaromyces proteolyticus TaxID=1131652 RepID=A0AAD4L145_9EURO|nr:uncharacterized protein BGW36DRAFT_372417 [Talaromyces proteolyticus]KAH8702221.1 hypothetical protein BGW36DRAFT_372417 [Talaromyces proteolyticus]